MSLINKIFGYKDWETYYTSFQEKFPRIEVELCFLDPRRLKIPKEKFISLLENPKLGINLNKINYGGPSYSIDKGIKLLEKISTEEFEFRGIYAHSGNSFSSEDSIYFGGVIPFIQPGTYRVIWRGDCKNLDLSIFDELITDPEFVCMYAYWQFDNKLQNEHQLEWFYLQDKIDFPKNKIIVDPNHSDRKILNIDGNPGRDRQVQNMILRSCWRMWFSEKYFQVIPKIKIETFNGARQNLILENGLHFIELYANPYDAAKKESREIQKKFNEWIDIEGVFKYHQEHFGASIPIN